MRTRATRTGARSLAFLALLASGPLLFSGCASTPEPAAPPLTWPAPPEKPRVRFERVLQERTDVAPRGFFSRLAGGEVPPLFQRPHGVTWDGKDLVVADPGARRVVRISLESGKIDETGEGVLEDPIAVAACPAGIVVAESRPGRVVLLDRSLGRRKVLAENLQRPSAVACSGDRTYVVETGAHRVVVLEAGGGRSTWGSRGDGPGQFNFPVATALSEGVLWIGDTLNFRIQRLDAGTGEILGSFGGLGDTAGDMPRLKGIAVDASRTVWTTDAFLDQVALYNEQGDFLMVIGNPGTDRGEFQFPAGIAVGPDGLVAVTESIGKRIQIFRILDSRKDGK